MLKENEVCSSIFLDIFQAFSKVCKVANLQSKTRFSKTIFPDPTCLILLSPYGSKYSKYKEITSGIPQIRVPWINFTFSLHQTHTLKIKLEPPLRTILPLWALGKLSKIKTENCKKLWIKSDLGPKMVC